MPQNLTTLVVAALEELEQTRDLQEILEICMEQFDNPSQKAQFRVQLLISIYLPAVELRLGELRFALEKLRQQLGTDE